MRPHLNERASNELLEIMRHYDHGSPNHTLNILISSLHDSLFKTKRPSPSDEVNINDYSSTEQQ
jgi:HAMP domain-containing protein